MRRALPWALVSAVAGGALWLALVPHAKPSGDARVTAFWWLAIAAVVALTLLARDRARYVVGLSVGVPPFLLSFFTAPHGDDDGLWILYVPLTAVFAAFLLGVELLVRYLRGRVRPS
jgi:hypothetical protein